MGRRARKVRSERSEANGLSGSLAKIRKMPTRTVRKSRMFQVDLRYAFGCRTRPYTMIFINASRLNAKTKKRSSQPCRHLNTFSEHQCAEKQHASQLYGPVSATLSPDRTGACQDMPICVEVIQCTVPDAPALVYQSRVQLPHGQLVELSITCRLVQSTPHASVRGICAIPKRSTADGRTWTASKYNNH